MPVESAGPMFRARCPFCTWRSTAEAADRRIVAVDWSTPGEVEVTWIVSAP